MSQIKVDSIVPRGGLPSGAFSGGIIQCVTAQTNNLVDYSGSTSWRDVLSLTITPASASSKILLLSQCTVGRGNSHPEAGSRYLRGSTVVYVHADPLSNQIPRGNAWGRDCDEDYSATTSYLGQVDSPSTTSATTYKLQVQVSESNTWHLNRTYTNTDYGMNGTTTMQAFELTA